MPRNGRPADRQLVGELLYRAAALPKQLDDGATVRISKGAEGIVCSRGLAHGFAW